MESLLFLAPFVVLGVAVLFIAFSGGPGRAREAYMTRGGRGFRVVILAIYLALGVGVPVAVIAARGDALGAGRLAATPEDATLARGKELFAQTCATCHSLGAVNARGVTGPSLDELGEMTPERVLTAIETGGTGKGLMPAKLLEGEDAQAVAEYLAAVAGKSR